MDSIFFVYICTMTCIVGYIEKQTVVIGGDSAGVSGLSIHKRKDAKVFQNGPFIMGFTSSFRMGQLLMSSSFKPPKQGKEQSDYDYMITTFINAVKDCYKQGGYTLKYRDGDDKGGTFLVGYKGVLYMVEDDFQVAIHHDNYIAIGCGSELAEGAMYALEQVTSTELSAVDKIKIALSAAANFSGGVEPPFNFVEMSKKNSILETAKIQGKIKKKKKN